MAQYSSRKHDFNCAKFIMSKRKLINFDLNVCPWYISYEKKASSQQLVDLLEDYRKTLKDREAAGERTTW